MLTKEALDRRTRIEAAISRAGINSQGEAAERCGVSQQTLNDVMSGRRPGIELVKKLAEITGVSYEWLRFGDQDKAPPWVHTGRGFSTLSPVTGTNETRVREAGPIYLPQLITVVGRVVAGDGKLSDESAIEMEGLPGLVLPSTWSAVLVEGMSAYPVVYPGQIVLIDTARAARPNTPDWNDDTRTDLHDNLVLIETDEPPEIGKATSGHRAYLKRFCMDRRAPDGFVLASIDSGRSSPYVPVEHILMIVPVVGVLYQDPRRPREKRWHAKTVVATIHP